MISYQQVAEQLHAYTQRLQVATTDAERRECFAAIRALCDVGLAGGGGVPQVTSPPVQKPSSPAPIGQVQSAPAVPLSGKRFEEDDANGDSLFDF